MRPLGFATRGYSRSALRSFCSLRTSHSFGRPDLASELPLVPRVVNAPRCEHERRPTCSRMQLRFFKMHLCFFFEHSSFITWAFFFRTCHDNDVQQGQFSMIYHHYRIRKSAQIHSFIAGLPQSCDKHSWHHLINFQLPALKPTFDFFDLTVFTNPQITKSFDLVLNNVTCDETTSPLSFALKKFPWYCS